MKGLYPLLREKPRELRHLAPPSDEDVSLVGPVWGKADVLRHGELIRELLVLARARDLPVLAAV